MPCSSTAGVQRQPLRRALLRSSTFHDAAGAPRCTSAQAPRDLAVPPFLGPCALQNEQLGLLPLRSAHRGRQQRRQLALGALQPSMARSELLLHAGSSAQNRRDDAAASVAAGSDRFSPCDGSGRTHVAQQLDHLWEGDFAGVRGRRGHGLVFNIEQCTRSAPLASLCSRLGGCVERSVRNHPVSARRGDGVSAHYGRLEV